MLRVYYEALAGFRRFGAISVALLFLSGVAEAFGVASMLPILSSRLSREAGGRSEWFGLSGDTLMFAAVGLLVGLGLLAAWLRFVGERRAYVLAASIERSLRYRMAAALLGMRWTSYIPLPLGDVLKAVMVEGGQIGAGGLALVSALGNAALAVAFVTMALVVNPIMTLAVLVFGAITAVFYRRAGRRSEDLSRGLSTQSAALSQSAANMFVYSKFVRSVGLDDRALEQLDADSAELARQFVRVQRYIPVTRFIFDGFGLLFIGLMLIASLVVFPTSFAGAIVFLALFYRLAPRLQLTQQGFLQAKTQTAWWFTWKAQYDAALAVADRPNGHVRFEKPPRIEFDHVSLGYPERPAPALADVSFTIAPGECLAVVGESGGGKTTTLDLVTGLLFPTSGIIRLDDTELRDVDIDAWRHHIGLVMQDSPIFYGTVLDNISFGDPSIDEARAQRAVAMANLTELIRDLPQGLHTDVGQMGATLSGGQRQRLALARAIYREPWLLILDEATSSLDSQSEQVIQDALGALKGSQSILIVAHRLKTVRMADRILVLSRGRVVEEGTWEDLSSRDGVFRRMLVAQAA